MPDPSPTHHGDIRPGAGRKTCSGPFGEATLPVRLSALRSWLATLPAGLASVAPQAFARYPSALARPLYGSRIAAGFPSPADDDLEGTIDLNAHLVRHPAATFFLRV